MERDNENNGFEGVSGYFVEGVSNTVQDTDTGTHGNKEKNSSGKIDEILQNLPKLETLIHLFRIQLAEILEEERTKILQHIHNMHFGQIMNYLVSNKTALDQTPALRRVVLEHMLIQKTMLVPQAKMFMQIVKEHDPELHQIWLQQLKIQAKDNRNGTQERTVSSAND